ncbi:methyl-CpG-binding domain protein 2 isoform X5 [Trematomus bernacchii]|uniref:methyl-CpG-binding domain protein 2 isoform X5 n=1 Tax=Trematomus bernacchii TaxID=40690 RepID=UPI00146D4339|nr:methyl-CpG-binding domain protein 2 isoform X5 [Trematomus bernacchii]
MMEKKRTECPALPPGWRKEEVIRKSGLSAGKSDVYYYRQCMAQRNRQNSDPSPSGKKFRSKPQLSRYLGNTVDLGCFDFRTGKMMPGKLQKNKQRLRNDPLSLAKLFWERRLKGLRSSDITEEVLQTLDLPKGLQSVGPDSSDDTLLSAIASALHMSSAPITGQMSVAAEKSPVVWLNTSQPLCRAFNVTDQHIRLETLCIPLTVQNMPYWVESPIAGAVKIVRTMMISHLTVRYCNSDSINVSPIA